MAKTSSFLKWCIVRFSEDMNWWVEETSDPIHWDVDGLSILDPKQVNHVLDLMDPLRDYKLQPELFDLAFYSFSIKADQGNGRVRLEHSLDSLMDSDELLFGLPDILDEDKSPYADFLNHITKLRVKLLNDLIDFDQPLTVEEVEEVLRERQNNDFMEGRSTHIFNEICDILEYIPHGYELELDEVEKKHKDTDEKIELEEDLPEIEEEDIEEDETMKWDDDEESEEDENQEDEEEEDDLPRFKKGAKSKKSAKKTTSVKSKKTK